MINTVSSGRALSAPSYALGAAGGSVTPDEKRQRGLRKVALGVALVVLVIIFTLIIMPLYYR